MGAQPLGFAPSQPFRVYPWLPCVPPCAGLCSMPGVHRVITPSTPLSKVELHVTYSVFSSHSINMVGHTAFGAWQSHLIPPPSLHEGGVFFFRVPSTQ